MLRARSAGHTLAAALAAAALIARPPAEAQQREVAAFGTFDYVRTTTGVLVAAPHGTADVNTAPLAALAAGELGAGYVLARGFTPGVRINVNRPTEGGGLPCDREPHTPRAEEAFSQYRVLVSLASNGAPLRLYAEVHGSADAASDDRIEVATKGISTDEAAAAKARFPEAEARVRADTPAFPALRLLIEPVDRLRLSAECDKRVGMLAETSIARALHIELPAAARRDALLPAAARLLAALIRPLSGP